MVDFQSRETRRDLGSDDEDEGSEEAEGVEDQAVENEDAEGGTRSTETDDESGEEDRVALLATGPAETTARDAVVDALESAGYAIVSGDRRAPDHDRIQGAVDDFVDRADVVAVVTVGGTGVTPEDRTVDAVDALFTKSLPGFGEAFRRRWSEESGDPAVGSRVAAGLADDTPVFCLPGEPDAATLAVRELVAPDAAAIHRMASGD